MDPEVAQLKWTKMTDMSQGMSLLGREIVPVFVLEEQGCSPPKPKRQELRARSPVESQATMFDWHRDLQPLSVRESRVGNTGDCQSQMIIEFLKCRVVS